MKYVIIVGDGMSDRPMAELDGKTCLESARTPSMDRIAERGRSGLLNTLYDDLPLDSGVANMTLMGYDPHEYFPGRGAIEASVMGVELGASDVAFRCNLVSASKGVLEDFTSGHVTSMEAAELMGFINEELGGDGIEFYPGVSYRNICVLRGKYSPEVECTPPHDVVGKAVKDYPVKAKSPDAEDTAHLLNRLMLDSRGLLGVHPVNKVRGAAGKKPANLLWFWGPGSALKIPAFKEKHGVSGAVISAVDVLKGIGRLSGLKIIEVEGATGYIDTNYEGKVDAALKALEDVDLVYLHIEATDETGHEGDAEKKIQAIEALDKRVVGRVLEGLSGEYTVAILPDHATPCEVRTHTRDPVPFSIYSTSGKPDSVRVYSEKAAADGVYGIHPGADFMKLLLGR